MTERKIDADEGLEQLQGSISPRLHLMSWLDGLMRADLYK